MEYDAKRQMETKAKEAIFSLLFQKRAATPHLILRVRRDYLIEDSLSQISENEMELKKSLRIEFVDEIGVDGGGLRKEWFLLLALARGLDQLLKFEGDVESTFCRDFVGEYEAFDDIKRVPLIHNGQNIPLFQPEEIELLVRGSAEPLEIEQLRSVTVYEGFREDEATIINFWAIFKAMDPMMQRKLLTFVTGTDRIPATG
ncbi:5956_t:CDS:2, partial [Racocetra fulgida]